MNNVSSSNSQKALVPELRFPEFRDDLKQSKLSDISVYKTKRATDVKSHYVSTENLLQNCMGIVPYTDKTAIDGISFSINDILLGNIRPYLKKAWLAEFDGVCSTDVLVLHPLKIEPSYFKYLICRDKFFTYAMSSAKGSKMPRGDKAFIMDMTISLPSINEQKKLASMLMLIDTLISKQEKLVDELKLYKRGLIFSLFKENNVFNLPVERLPLSTLLTEYKNKNSVGLRVCSVAVNKGVVDQVEHLGRSFSANDTSKYNQVKQGDIIYTKSPTGDFPFGIVKQNKLNEVVAVSPLYGVYTPKNYEVGNLLHHYFEQHQNANNYIKPLAQKGAKNTINITNQNFLAGNVLFPKNSNDIVKMSQAFETIQKQIECNELLHNQLILTKSYFLQKMFI